MKYSRGSIILAGGESNRIGALKPLITFKKKPLITHIINKISTLISEIIVVISEGMEADPFRRVNNHIRIVYDGPGNPCPVRGFKAGLGSSKTDYIILLPCDTPFLKTELVKYLFDAALGFDVAVPKWENGYIEPLCAVYNVRRNKSIIKSYSPTSMRDVVLTNNNLRYVPISELNRFDPQVHSFFNINTVEDLRRAEFIVDEINFQE